MPARARQSFAGQLMQADGEHDLAACQGDLELVKARRIGNAGDKGGVAQVVQAHPEAHAEVAGNGQISAREGDGLAIKHLEVIVRDVVVAGERIAADQDFIVVAHAVIVRVNGARVGAGKLLLQVGEVVGVCVAVRSLRRIIRIGAAQEFIQVVEAVLIGIRELLAGSQQTAEMQIFPVISNLVLVDVKHRILQFRGEFCTREDASHGEVRQSDGRIVDQADSSRSKVLRRGAAVIEGGVQN